MIINVCVSNHLVFIFSNCFDLTNDGDVWIINSIWPTIWYLYVMLSLCGRDWEGRLFATKMFPVDESDDKISSLKILYIVDHELIRVFLHFYGNLLSNKKLWKPHVIPVKQTYKTHVTPVWLASIRGTWFLCCILWEKHVIYKQETCDTHARGMW